jgi:general secretion pathway protein G
MNRNKGFTLVEMLLVVVVIGVLAAMVVPKFTNRSEQAKIGAAVADIEAGFASALDLYEVDNGVYPTTEQNLSALLAQPSLSPVPQKWRGPYLKKKSIIDPWGNSYIYRSPGTHNNDYDLSSSGPDGIEGTSDDINNWDDHNHST